MTARFIQAGRRRMSAHLWPILQTAVAAVLAWYVATLIGTEPRPVFASIAAVVSLGATFGERRQRALQLISGVMLGIVVADALVRTIGVGLPQIGLLVVLAMVTAVVLGGGELLVTESAVSAMLVASVSSRPDVRMLEVLIGGGVALSVHAFVFPPDPVLSVARVASSVFGEMGSALLDAAAALGTGDVRRAEAAGRAAGHVEDAIDDLSQAVLVSAETARWAPSRRRARPEVERYRRTIPHADLTAGDARVLTRRVLQYVRGGHPAAPELAETIRDLGIAIHELPPQFHEPWRSGDVLRTALQAAGRATALAARHPDAGLGEIAGAVRTVAIDIVKTSELAESESGAIAEAPTEELLAALPAPDPVTSS